MNRPDIAQAVLERKRAEIKQWPINSNRASEAGHPCIRYLVYLRTRWQDRSLHGVSLQLIFERGRVMEAQALKEIQEAGFEVVEQQRPYSWPELELTGYIDGQVEVDGKRYPIEVKSLSPYDFPHLNSIQDFLSSDKIWLRKYPAQLNLYLLMEGVESGILYIKNALTWEPKCIWVELDYDYADRIVRKLEEVNRHVEEGTVPEGINDADICPDCPFFHICLPEIKGQDLPIEDDSELISLLSEWEELKPLAARYNEIDGLLKKRLEGVEKAIVGNWLITGKYVERKGYTVEPGVYWQRKIRKIDGGER